MSDVRLRQPLTTEISRASAALDVAQQLADAGQGMAGRKADAGPAWRVVPDLGVFALGDQVAVTGLDLLTALRDVRPDVLVWGRGGRRTAGEVVAEVTESVRALRSVL